MGALVHPPVIGGSRAVKLASSAPGRRGLVVAGSPVAEGDDILAIRLRYTLSDAAIIDGCRCPLPAAVREVNGRCFAIAQCPLSASHTPALLCLQESWEVRLGATMLWAARAGCEGPAGSLPFVQPAMPGRSFTTTPQLCRLPRSPPGLRRLWRRYVRLLPPASEGCSGLVASDLALALTRAPHLVASLESRRRKIDEVFSMHLAHRPDLGCRSADELRWAAASVESRAFQAHGPHGWAREAFMLPFVDMCNHAADPNASVVRSWCYLMLAQHAQHMHDEIPFPRAQEFPARPESDDWATSDARVCLRAMRRIALGEVRAALTSCAGAPTHRQRPFKQAAVCWPAGGRHFLRLQAIFGHVGAVRVFRPRQPRLRRVPGRRHRGRRADRRPAQSAGPAQSSLLEILGQTPHGGVGWP